MDDFDEAEGLELDKVEEGDTRWRLPERALEGSGRLMYLGSIVGKEVGGGSVVH